MKEDNLISENANLSIAEASNAKKLSIFGDKDRERILAYLGLDALSDIDELEGAVARAFEVEEDYAAQLNAGEFGYALTCDFESMPWVIEDPEIYKDLDEVESFAGITVYKKIKR